MSNYIDTSLENTIIDWNMEMKGFTLENKSLGVSNWQLAYWARELRQRKEVTVTCSRHEAEQVLKQLSSFSYSNHVHKRIINEQRSDLITLEISAA